MPNIEVMDASDLVQNTLFLRVGFGSLGNSKKVGEDVLDTSADHGYIKVSKTLLDSPELDAISKADANLRIYLRQVCLPFVKGMALIPNNMIMHVRERLLSHQTERAGLVDLLIASYPLRLAQAETNLGPLFHADDYPSVQTLREKFTFDWDFIGLGTPEALRSISEEVFKAEQERSAEKFRSASEEITNLMRQTLFDMVSNLQDKLTDTTDGKTKRLHESAVLKLQEFLTTFDLRNVTNDQELSTVIDQAKLLLLGINVQNLRSNDEFREQIRTGMENITTSLSGMIENKPNRKIREEEE